MQSDSAKKHEIDMTEGKLFSKIVAFAVPLMLTAILQLLFNTADMVVVGKFVGEDEVGAIGSTGSLNHLIINLVLGLSIGAGVALSNAFGQKNAEYADKILHTAMIVGTIGGVIIGVIGYFVSPGLLVLMKTLDKQLPAATLYIKIIFLGAPFNAIYNFGAAMLRAIGDTKRPLLYLTIAGVVNIVVNVISVTLLKMGVAGVALATIISQAISAALVVIALIENKGFVKLSPKKLSVDKRAFGEILRLGIPTGLQSACFSISNVLLQTAVNGLGSKEAVNGCAIASQIEAYVYALISSVSSTALTVVGQNYGAGDYKRIKKSIFECYATIIVLSLCVGWTAIAFYAPLTGLFTNGQSSPEATALTVEYARRRMLIVCSLYFIDGIMEVSAFSLRGMSYSLLPMVMVLLGTCVFRIVWIYCIFPLCKTFDFLFAIYPVSWAITFVACTIALVICYKKSKEKQEKSALKAENDSVCA